ncbi:MAG: SigB/SigF/SigG family RNA polymerase sigma factor [Christensenellaceae bacterium]|jgi:RNA polymerase sporulation-specific sigma factor|nr:SigB/SigF/SigG family RNA polymerase sigma factor [Christensenellaceae bacterium]
MLDNDKVADLILRAKSGEDKAKEELILTNSPLIKSILRRYIGRGVEYDDLYQLGCMGFVKAINKYDPKYNVKFTTYAMPLIMGEIKRFLRDDGAIKVSRSVKSLYIKIKKYLAEHSGDEQSKTVDEIAKHFEVTREEVVFAMEAARMPLSLFDKSDNDSDDDSLCIGEKLVGDDDTKFTDNLMIKNVLADLPERERKVILLRYYRNATQSEVARALNLSQVQVSRIEQKVLADLRTYFTADENLA